MIRGPYVNLQSFPPLTESIANTPSIELPETRPAKNGVTEPCYAKYDASDAACSAKNGVTDPNCYAKFGVTRPLVLIPIPKDNTAATASPSAEFYQGTGTGGGGGEMGKGAPDPATLAALSFVGSRKVRLELAAIATPEIAAAAVTIAKSAKNIRSTWQHVAIGLIRDGTAAEEAARIRTKKAQHAPATTPPPAISHGGTSDEADRRRSELRALVAAAEPATVAAATAAALAVWREKHPEIRPPGFLAARDESAAEIRRAATSSRALMPMVWAELTSKSHAENHENTAELTAKTGV